MAKFSVLIPVYNTEKYLEDCVDSVLNQTYQNFEIILIDDGSIDASGRICDKYSAKDARIKVIHQQNQGPLLARITAFLESGGEYVIYMDSDDCWSKELLMNVNRIINKYKGDVVSFDFQLMEEDAWREQNETNFGTGDIKIYECDQLITELLSTETENSLCKRAVRRKVVDIKGLEKLKGFGKILLGEDMLQAFVMIKDCEKIVHLDQPLYYYRRSSGSITNSRNPALAVDIARARELLAEILKETRFDTAECQRMVERNFLEHYLTDLVGICCIHDINTMKKVAYDIRCMEIYKRSCRNLFKWHMTKKRKLLLYLEQREWWRCYWAVSKIYCLKRYIYRGV